MKRLTVLLLAVIIILNMIGCVNEVDLDGTTQNANKTEEQELVDGNTDFAFKLYQSLKDNTGNIFFSPYSISSALAMTYAGARGETAAQNGGYTGFHLAAGQVASGILCYQHIHK